MLHALLNETIGPGENTALVSQLFYYKIFKFSLIIQLRQFKEEWYLTTNGTPLDPFDFLLPFPKNLTFFISSSVMFSGKPLLRNHDFTLVQCFK